MAAKTFGASGGQPWLIEVNKAVDYTVLNTDNGTLFTTGGGATRTFTLPSLANGVGCTFWFLNLQNNNMVITAPANKFVLLNNATATTATFSTASQLIGAMAMVTMNLAGTFYYLLNVSAGTAAITVS